MLGCYVFFFTLLQDVEGKEPVSASVVAIVA